MRVLFVASIALFIAACSGGSAPSTPTVIPTPTIDVCSNLRYDLAVSTTGVAARIFVDALIAYDCLGTPTPAH